MGSLLVLGEYVIVVLDVENVTVQLALDIVRGTHLRLVNELLGDRNLDTSTQ